ncbi:MAG TPA: hypothetical protein DIS90_00655 [Cytophagales bacterium]|nr:hypothetical protein [Cytophagales bacterium]
MKKFLIVTGIGFLILMGVLAYIRFYYTKTFSPEATVEYNQNGTQLSVAYNRPYKKGRVIFGELVPYDVVWRTGANEATVFGTNKNLIIKGQSLKAGKYSLWTVPGEQSWKVIFNTESGQWGVDFNGSANRDPKNDVLTVEVPALTHDKEFEQFTISIEQVGEDFELILMWDKTVVVVPISLA